MDVNIDISLVDDLQELSLESAIKTQKSAEELDRLTVDEKLAPIERSVYLLSSGQPVQQISVITALPDLLKENNADCMRRVVPKVREVLHVAQQDMQLAACSSFLQILQKQLLPVPNYTQTFLQTIITSLDSRDPDIVKAWLETLLDVIDLLPKDVIKKEILTVAITKGQLSQSVQSRLSCCQILGKIATKFEPFVIKKDILPIVQSLCQDVDYEVRACMCRQLDPVARGLGLEQTKSSILPELVELTNDEESHVRLAGLETVVKILSLLDNETCTNTIIPLVCKFCQHAMNKEDVTLPFVAKQLGKLCHQLQSNLTDEQKKWFVDYYKKLCKLGVREADRPCNKDPDDTPPTPKNGPVGFFPQTSEFEEEDPTVETRKNAAYNFPAMVLFIGPKSFKSELFSSFSSLCTDPSYVARKSIAMGFHEVVKALHNNCFHLINDLNHLFKDDSLEVLQGLVTHLSETLESLAKCVNNTTTNAEAKQNAFFDLIPSMLQCEAVISSSNNWRLQASFLEALICLPSCYNSDLIFQKFVPLLFKKILYARALPVKDAAGKTLLVLLRNNYRLEQRQDICVRLVEDLCHGRSCYHRNMFIEMCKLIMDDFSKAFFKDFFFEFLIELCADKVPNVRLRICALFPRLKKQIKLPADRNLLQQLETCVRKLLMSENDRDVKDVLDKSVKEFDRVQMHVGTRNQSQEEEQADRKKEEWEKKLIEVEEKEKEEEAKLTGKTDKRKDAASKSSNKLQPSNKRVGGKTPAATSVSKDRNTLTAGGVKTERSGSFAGSSASPTGVNDKKISPSNRAARLSGRNANGNSPKLLSPSSANSPNTRKGSANSISSSSSLSSASSRRSSTGSSPSQDTLRKSSGSNRKISTGSMNTSTNGSVGNRKK